MIATVGALAIVSPIVQKFLSLILVVDREEVRGEWEVAMAISIRSGSRLGFTVVTFVRLTFGLVVGLVLRLVLIFVLVFSESRTLEGRERLTVTSLCKSESFYHSVEVQLIFGNLEVMHKDTIQLVAEVRKTSIDEELSTKEVVRKPPSMRWAKAIHGELCIGVGSHMPGHKQGNTFILTLVERVALVSWLDVDSFEDLLCSVFRS